MGLLDEITSKLGQQSDNPEAKAGSLLTGLMQMFSNPGTGGLQGLLNSFHQKGLGDIVSSWVSNGENKSISAEQVKEGLGADKVRDLAVQAGVSEDEAANHLSRHLPDFINRLTPEGKIPEGGWMEKGMEFLKGKFL